MPSKSARIRNSVRTVVFVVYPGVKLLDLAGPLQVFSDALEDNGKNAYHTVVASIDGATVQTDTCISLQCEPLANWTRRKIDTLIIVGGNGVFAAMSDARLSSSIIRLAGRSRRVASVCSGAFLLAQSGLLDNRRATTHWDSTSKLGADFPNIQVEENPIYIKDKNIWTSAGVTAGIDMALAMLNEDLGRATALSQARSLVTYLVRPGGQSQFSEALALQTSDNNTRFDKLHHWLLNNLQKELRVELLAEKVNMSPRHFSRIYLLETGRTPAKAVEAIRVEAARRLLEDGKLSIAAIARRCGFGDDERMRRSFIRIVKVPPSHYSKNKRSNR